ncbi:hypothetical protein [Paenibacillus sp. FSL W7-1287]|uniref:hypothetical protein n=1 Tax=Paenibacillus sp. FSL W7-1287 TaxID=2954538 RepID=UPI0030FC3452
MEAKSPLVAFLLSFIPGVGHLYIGRIIRFLFYAGGFFGPLGFMFLLLITGGNVYGDDFVVGLVISFIFACLNMLDMIITIANGKHRAFQPQAVVQNGIVIEPDPLHVVEQQEKTKMMMLSILPGLGHMYMGLMQRGITLMITFIGGFGVVLFIATVLRTPSILVLWLALPIIWIYCMFDAMSLLARKQRGELLEDQSLFAHVEEHLASGKKNRATAMILSIFPGAGHLYLGLQQRGLQLMGLFLISIFVMDQLRLTLFLFLLPLLWCFAFFDVMVQLRKLSEHGLQDEPFVATFMPYQRWIGAGLLLVGIYYLLDRIAQQVIQPRFHELWRQYVEFKYMIPTIVIAFILILLGIKLLFGTNASNKERYRRED